MILSLYTALLRLYPRQYRKDFGEEMKIVFGESLSSSPGRQMGISIFLRELRDLPIALFIAYTSDWFKGGEMSSQNDYIVQSTHWEALIGTFPFLAFGLVSMLGKLDQVHPYLEFFSEFNLFVLVLAGFILGWKRGFPLWSYSYLGWSLLFTWSGSGTYINRVYMGYRYITLFLIAMLIAVLWTRSFDPIKTLFRDIWNDWTRLSLAMFAFAGFMGLIYDENHHPQLLWFMLATILAISMGVWIFLRSSSLKVRVLSIVGAFVAAYGINSICEATWDFHAYHGLPEPVRNWYQSLGITLLILTFWVALVFWPAILTVVRKILQKQRFG